MAKKNGRPITTGLARAEPFTTRLKTEAREALELAAERTGRPRWLLVNDALLKLYGGRSTAA